MIKYTRREEIWNAASHGGGIVLGVVFGIIFLVWCFQSDNNWARVGVILYLFGMLGSYVASTLYHSMKHHSKWKERLRRWDHAAIYWHIAGSYSPLTLVALRDQGYWGWSLFIFVWACAVAGTITSFIHLKYGSECARGLQAPDCLSLHRGLYLDCGRRRQLYHGCRVLLVEQEKVHALRLPFLRPSRLRMPYHRRLGCADDVPLIYS